MDPYLQILLYFVALGVGYFIRGYLAEKGKTIATKQDIEEITQKIEGIKVQFFEHQTHYSLYHKKKFEVLGKIFELLYDPFVYIKDMVHPMQFGGQEDEKKRRKRAFNSFNKFSGYYWKHKIYLPQDICIEIEEVLDLMKDATTNYRIARENNNDIKRWHNSYKTMRTKVPKLREKLGNKFRKEINTPSYQTDGEDA